MEASPRDPAGESDLDARWSLRERAWRSKLGRLRLGVEPIEEQLARYRRVTWLLTAIPIVLGIMFLVLFTVFGRPDIGLFLIALLVATIALGAWVDHALLARRARRYLAERADYLREKALEAERARASSATSKPA
jgi:hypothetical protein